MKSAFRANVGINSSSFVKAQDESTQQSALLNVSASDKLMQSPVVVGETVSLLKDVIVTTTNSKYNIDQVFRGLYRACRSDKEMNSDDVEMVL